MLLAFRAAFSQLNIFARSIEVARQRKKGFVWRYLLGDFAAGWQIWKEIKGIRWLPLVGAALCFTSYVVYRVYLAKV